MRSTVVHAVVMVLVWVALLFPAWPEPLLWGVLWTGLGVMMVSCPPRIAMPWVWYASCGGFLLAGLLGFLPEGVFSRPAWREEVRLLGADPGSCGFVQPRLAAEAFLSLAVSAVAVIYLCGHRVDSGRHQRLILWHACSLAVIAALAMIFQQEGEVFGFFPNRNHMATLLATGVFAGLASFAHAIRTRSPVSGLLSLVAAATCLVALVLRCESRAGLVLLGCGIGLWLGLMGLRQLTGQTGKAVALAAFAIVGAFLVVDSKAKVRLLGSLVGAAGGAADVSGGGEPLASASPLESRITIFRDTVRMITAEPASGVGAGQFRYVFPQYRHESRSPHMAVHVHPESDWLWLAAEIGVPGAACVAMGLLMVGWSAYRGVRKASPSRPLVTGSLVAGSMVVLHGLFDVPGHQVGLVLGGGWLLALALRREGQEGRGCPRLVTMGWRGAGLAIGGMGVVLLAAELTNGEVLEIARVKHAMNQVGELYEIDRIAAEAAQEEGREYEPSREEDPLARAIDILGGIESSAPLDPQIYRIRGTLEAHIGGDPASVEKSFAIQSRLLPSRVGVMLDQARAWYPINPTKSLACWREALVRARKEQRLHPDSEFQLERTSAKIMNEIRYDDERMRAMLALTPDFPELALSWASVAKQPMMDEAMPGLISISDAQVADKLWELWRKRGGKDAIEAHLKSTAEPSILPRE